MHHADEGQKLTSGRAARKQKAKDKKKGQQQSFYDTKAWLTSSFSSANPTAGSGKSAGKGKGQWLPDRSVQAIPGDRAIQLLQDQKPLPTDTVVVHTAAQASKLQDLARVNEVQDKIAVVCPGELGEEAGKRDVTCIRGDQRQVQAWNAVALTPGGLPEKPTVRKVSTFKPPSRNLQTLRVLCPRDYMDPEMWRALQQYPSEVVKRCTSISFIKAESWRITTEGTEHLMTGYLTYEQSQAVSALQLSGPHGSSWKLLRGTHRGEPWHSGCHPESIRDKLISEQCLLRPRVNHWHFGREGAPRWGCGSLRAVLLLLLRAPGE